LRKFMARFSVFFHMHIGFFCGDIGLFCGD